jgi:hypothetical protein
MGAARLALPLLLPVVLLASCADSGKVTAPPDRPTPNFDPANAPPQSGPHVFRLRFASVVFSGFETELAVAVGFDEPFADHCDDFESSNQPGSTQINITPPGDFHLKESGQDVSVLVFAAEGPVFDNCQLVGAPVVTSGTAHGTFTIAGRQGAATVHGVVDLASGGQARLLVTTITHFAADGSVVFDHTRITLTPL